VRIISGSLKSIVLRPPSGLPVRPTTDRAKESLFNILENQFDISALSVLDIFSGTGNISYEFCSRGAKQVIAVDIHSGCIQYIKEVKQKHFLNQLSVCRKDAFTYLNQCEQNQFDIIFADAPYALHRILDIPSIVLNKQLLKSNGLLIIEHDTNLEMQLQIGFFDKRTYGQSAFSFFRFS
jgi:16S rRNA (guanine(966)-N(2))-methyltransferase RsmD